MHSSFSIDLKTARRRSGLSQADCGHLLGVDKRRISAFESGKSIPTVPEICGLSLIFGCSFETLFASVFSEVGSDIERRLAHMPTCGYSFLGHFNRVHTLNRIAARLSDHQRFRGSA